MNLKLYLHPLSSYCHKALIAFYENGIPFDAKRIDDASVAAEFRKLWPIGRFPLLVPAGGGLLGYIAGDIATTDVVVKPWIDAAAPDLHSIAPLVGAIVVVAGGAWVTRRHRGGRKKVQ